MMTEAGVDVIVPWAAARCVTQWKGERAAKSLARWRSTAREAGKQSRRFHLPEVPELATTARSPQLLVRGGAGHGAARGGGRAAVDACSFPPRATSSWWSAPRAGVSDEEIAAFRAAKAVPALLGPTVLRTSTAGVAAGRCSRRVPAAGDLSAARTAPLAMTPAGQGRRWRHSPHAHHEWKASRAGRGRSTGAPSRRTLAAHGGGDGRARLRRQRGRRVVRRRALLGRTWVHRRDRGLQKRRGRRRRRGLGLLALSGVSSGGTGCWWRSGRSARAWP